MSYVSISNLYVSYGEVMAVRGLSFSIPQGEVFGFIGPNGAGKTSTIKVLATLVRPNSGAVMIDNTSVTANPMKVRRKIGYMPDFFGTYDDLTVEEYLHFFAAAYEVPRNKRALVIPDVLALTDLEGKKDAQVDSLSRGMKQRLGVARLLVHDPDLLLLDEPASGLDPRARIEMRELIKELQAMGKTILISSHILHELSQVCTRIGIVEAGRMKAEGSLDEIFAKLRLKRVIHVQLANPEEEIVRRIDCIPGVITVEKQADRLALQIDEHELKVEDLLEAMIRAGARVQMFQPEAMDMETVFMKLTEGKVA